MKFGWETEFREQKIKRILSFELFKG